jgi:DNA-binding transcriptional LysR family regulator
LFQSRAKELLAYWKELEHTTRVRERDLTSKYYVGCHDSLGLYTLPTFLPQLMRANPLAEIELVHASSREITEGVIDFRLDFGIVADPRPHPDLVIRKLGTDDVCFVVSEDWKAPLDKKSLQNVVLICDPNIYQSKFLLKELTRKNISFRRHLHTTRLDLVASLVNEGAGVGILPIRSTKHLKAKSFVPVPGLPSMKNTVCLVYRHDTQHSVAARTMAKLIEEKARWSH